VTPEREAYLQAVTEWSLLPAFGVLGGTDPKSTPIKNRIATNEGT
jgi:hypothetical protein